MKTIKITLCILTIFGFLTVNYAQVPSYVPTNGLIGYFGFNNNGNDAISSSIPISNNAVSTTDRFGQANSAYQFNGSNLIEYTNTLHPLFNIGNTYQMFSINFWVNTTNTEGNLLGAFGWGYSVNLSANNYIQFTYISSNNPGTWTTLTSNMSIPLNNWQMITITRTGTTNSIYINGVLNNTLNNAPNILVYSNISCWFGANGQDNNGYLSGKLDDIGIWNRSLTQAEISTLYNACSGAIILSEPLNAITTVNSFALFSVTATSGSSFQWQSDPLHLGWQDIPNNNYYFGANSSSLSLINSSVSNHNQSFRVIASNGVCKDTSNIVNLTISDTCIISVTDTLIINATLSGLNPPLNINTLKIYPNPTSTHIIIDYGSFYLMSGYSLKISNAVGQTVFTTQINQQSSYIDLSSWTGNGLYFVQIISPQNVIIENRKIIVQ